MIDRQFAHLMKCMDEPIQITMQRLEAIALYPKLARAAVADRDKLSLMLNAKVADEFPPESMADVMEYFAQRLEADPNLVGWWGWYLVRHEPGQERVLIGSAGFNGYPAQDGNLNKHKSGRGEQGKQGEQGEKNLAFFPYYCCC